MDSYKTVDLYSLYKIGYRKDKQKDRIDLKYGQNRLVEEAMQRRAWQEALKGE